MRAKLPVLAVFLAAASGPALAAASGATASVTRFTIEVKDLDPHDGIDARANFPAGSKSSVHTLLSDNRGATAGFFHYETQEPFGSNGSTLTTPWVSASSFIGATYQGYHLGATGSTSAGQKSGEFYTHASLFVPVLLSPHTSITWKGQYALTAWAEIDKSAGRPPDAGAWVTWGEEGASKSRGVRVTRRSLDNEFKAGEFTFKLVNNTDVPLVRNGTLAVTALAGNPQMAAAVPEPETYALMLAGLGAVGFVARRRRR